MTKLNHVKKARKAIPASGIEVGDSYYWWKKRVNGKGVPRICSKTKPKRSAYATSSPFLGTLMDREDELNKLVSTGTSADEMATWLELVAQEIEALGDECLTKSSNVEMEMKNGAGTASAEALRERAEHCSTLASALREAVNELEAETNAPYYSEDEGDEEGDSGQQSTASVAEVVANISWLP